MNRVYKKQNYNIYQSDNDYIIHNTKKEFSEGHTHINNFKTAKYLINLCIHKTIPDRKYEYFIVSLARITDDNSYRSKLLKILDNKRKPQPYINKNNYCRL